MKRNIFVAGIIISIFTVTSCLENDDTGFIPTVAETNNSNYYGKDGEGDNDTIPTDSTDNTRPPTGGEEGHIPVKP